MSVTHRSAVVAIAAIVVSLFAPLPISQTAHATDQVAQRSQHRRAPDFTLTGIDGQKVSLKKYRREVVLVNFWAAWCVPCRAEIPRFRYSSIWKRDIIHRGFRLSALPWTTTLSRYGEFSKRFPINYPLVMADQRIAGLFGGVPLLPTTFLIGRDGRIADTVYGAISPARFAPEVEAALSANPRQNVRRSPPGESPSTP